MTIDAIWLVPAFLAGAIFIYLWVTFIDTLD